MPPLCYAFEHAAPAVSARKLGLVQLDVAVCALISLWLDHFDPVQDNVADMLFLSAKELAELLGRFHGLIVGYKELIGICNQDPIAGVHIILHAFEIPDSLVKVLSGPRRYQIRGVPEDIFCTLHPLEVLQNVTEGLIPQIPVDAAPQVKTGQRS